MFKEKINRDEENLLRDYLGEREDLEKKIREAIKATKEGHGFVVGSRSFYDSIIGNRVNQLPIENRDLCDEEIMKIVNEINKEKEYGEEYEFIKKEEMAEGVEDFWEEERERGGHDPAL